MSTKISPERARDLLARAREAAAGAYAPYSGFRVGAALLTSDGRIYTGANVENAAYGETVCAERVAVFKAVSEGERRFQALAVMPAEGREVTPCGACRQVIQEFSPETLIITGDEGEPRMETLTELLPRAFKL